jgi:hypothetical protein
MKKLIFVTLFMLCQPLFGQNAIKDFFKYSTVYTSAFASNPMYAEEVWYTTQGGELFNYTEEYDFDYTATIGIRKVARYKYENKQNRFYDGQRESTTALSATVGSVRGFEYLAQYDLGRQQGRQYNNQRYFLRYLGHNFMFKGEYRFNGLSCLDYSQIESRLRLHIGELDFSAGIAGRLHKPYGYNPIADFLAHNPWWDLVRNMGYEDIYYGIDYDNDDEVDNFDWYWNDPNGERVADTDEDFRRYIYPGIVNEFNRMSIDSVGFLSSVSAIFGVDYYHYVENFWVHSWLNLLPYHQHIGGKEEFSYQNYVDGKQWFDHSGGLILGWKIGSNWGVFTESEYMRYWDKNIFSIRAGINYQFR